MITAVKRGVLTGNVNSGNLLNSNIFDRAWWVSLLILVILHASDMPFFDSRLNIAGWILLAGLRCLIIPPQKSTVSNLAPFVGA